MKIRIDIRRDFWVEVNTIIPGCYLKADPDIGIGLNNKETEEVIKALQIALSRGE